MRILNKPQIAKAVTISIPIKDHAAIPTLLRRSFAGSRGGAGLDTVEPVSR